MSTYDTVSRIVHYLNDIVIGEHLTYILNREWPSEHRTSFANRRLWSHEWQQHGTCTGLSAYEYFCKIIDLHAEYDITEALQQDDVSTLSIAEDV